MKMKWWNVLALVVLAGGAGRAADWPTYLGGNNAFSETSGVKLIDDMSQVKPLWSFDDKGMGFGKAVSSAARDGFAKGTGLAYGGEASLIVADGKVIHFYTTPTGDAMWQSGDAIADEFKPFHKISADETVIALDAVTGEVRWKQVFEDTGLNMLPGKRGGFAVTPCAANGKVFAYGTTARVYCLDLETGKVLWESAVEPQHATLEKFKAEGLKARTAKDPRSRPYGMLQVVDDVLLVPGLAGIDTATGKQLWQLPNATSGYNTPAPVRIGGRNYLGCVNNTGELRLVEPKTGTVLWTHPLGSEHLTQPVFGQELLIAFESHPQFSGDMVGKSKVPNTLGNLAAYRLTEQGAEKVWSLPPEFLQSLCLDGGPNHKILARGGLVYAFMRKASGADPKQDTPCLVIVNEKDGKILKDATMGGGKYGGEGDVLGHNLNLWGDRLITVTDIQHRPRAANPEIWMMYNADPAAFRPLGKPWNVMSVHMATGGYEVPVLEPFADGIFYCRVWGGIRAYDLRRGP